jgi:cysteine desulfuration protein SufE
VADSALVRGIVAIMLALVNGKTAAQIKQMDLVGEFASLKLNLGAGRLNGVNSMIRFLQNL